MNAYEKVSKLIYSRHCIEIKNELQLNKKQITRCPASLDKKELALTDIKIMSILIAIGLIVFYGIYHVGIISRKKEYGIFHAIGMTRKSIRKLILSELYEIYAISLVFGIGTGYGIAALVNTLSGDNKQEIYLQNTKVEFTNVFPITQILICVIVIAFFVGVIGCIESRRIEKTPVITLLKDTEEKHKHTGRWIGLRERAGKNATFFMLGFKYIVRDFRTSLFVILTVCVGVTLFTGLAYQKKIAEINREDTREMYFLNGQYEMASLWVPSPLQGISRNDAKEIVALKNVTNVKTQAGMPVRIVDDKSIARNETYYDQMNQRFLDYEMAPIMGNDGTEDVYKTILYGYNQNALEKLKKYVVEGDFDASGLGSDEIILSILQMPDGKSNSNVGFYREGTPLMDYHVGDEIQMKYRKDFHTELTAYDFLEDSDGQYCYKTYKVKAIVSFSYMTDSTLSLFPLMITNDENIQKLCPDSHFHQIYLDGKYGLSGTQQTELERELISLGNKSENISTRSRIAEINENEMLYQKQLVYIIGIAVIALILVVINIITNLKYRMVIRTKEISMFRAIGMSIKMIRKVVLFENIMLFSMGSILSGILLQPVLRMIYHDSDMKLFGHPFRFETGAFLFIVIGVMLFCGASSVFMTKSWKTKKIMEQIGTL